MSKSKKQYIISIFILIVALGFGLGLGALTWIIKDTPDISNYKGSGETTLIYSADGQLLTKLFQENRIYVPLERIPKNLKEAIVAIEDKNFYVHHGIDFWGVGRAVITNIMKGRLAQGASTITQQLARNALGLTFKKSFYRKIQEAYLALQFERLYTKPEILEMYLNEIFLGHSAYGVETASLQYFGKDIWNLDLSECALIAGLPKAPNYYSPINNIKAAEKRRNIVLDKMQELGYITSTQADKAKKEEIKLKPAPPGHEETAPYFVRYIRDKLIDKFGAQMVYSGGLKVYTTLDLKMQETAEKSIDNAFKEKYIPTIKENNGKTQPQLALVTIDPKTGSIRAMVGGRGDDQFNRATQALRQPGSAFKPFVYTTAIKQGYSAASVINDMPMLASKNDKDSPLSIWPTNFQNEYRGYVSLRTALTHSINVAAVKLLKQVGVANTIKTAKEMGISSFQPEDNNEAHLSLALGGLNKGVSPMEMASAYGVFANQGIWVEPFAIKKILDKRNKIIYQAHPQKKIVLEKDTNYIMTSLLQSVINDGTGWRADLNRPVGGKTGTTNDYTDAWFVGFTPDLVTSVWIGEDNVKSMVYTQKDKNGHYLFSENGGPRTISSSEAAQLWGDYMRSVVKDYPVTDFSKPDNIVTEKIDPVTGLLPNKFTPVVKKEIFRKNNLPQKTEDIHGPVETVKIDKKTGLLATNNCPKDSIIERDYLTNNGIRVGPTTIKFSEKDNHDSERVHGTYIVNTGEPVQKIDPEYGTPEIKNGQVQYETKPTQKCTLHQETQDNILDNIWNFFKTND